MVTSSYTFAVYHIGAFGTRSRGSHLDTSSRGPLRSLASTGISSSRTGTEWRCQGRGESEGLQGHEEDSGKRSRYHRSSGYRRWTAWSCSVRWDSSADESRPWTIGLHRPLPSSPLHEPVHLHFVRELGCHDDLDVFRSSLAVQDQITVGRPRDIQLARNRKSVVLASHHITSISLANSSSRTI